jgi:hypothetical protein
MRIARAIRRSADEALPITTERARRSRLGRAAPMNRPSPILGWHEAGE